jgi:hypothetical protein
LPLPEDFADEALYGPEAWFVHDLVELDPERNLVVARIDTTRLGLLVDAQRELPGHSKHFPGAIALQVTGTLGQLHATYCLGLRASQGWVGFGTHVLEARFVKLGRIGPEVIARCEATRVRRFRGNVFIDYDFEYSQEGEPIYVSRQRAAWTNGAAQT